MGGNVGWPAAGGGGSGYWGGGAGAGYYNGGGGGSSFTHETRCTGFVHGMRSSYHDELPSHADDPAYVTGVATPRMPNAADMTLPGGNGLVVIESHAPPSPPPPGAPPPPPLPPNGQHAMPFMYTGTTQTLTIAPHHGDTIVVKLWGAAGGSLSTGSAVEVGGFGAFVSCTLTGVKTGDKFSIVVGEGGEGPGTHVAGKRTFGGGGTSTNGGQGGGISGIFAMGSGGTTAITQAEAIAIAGAGGGAHVAANYNAIGGSGGFPTGAKGSGMSGNPPGGDAGHGTGPGGGGTQTAGGAAGYGGRKSAGAAGDALMGANAVWSSAGAGGSGYWGGGSGSGYYNGGGGGSSYTHTTKCTGVVHKTETTADGYASDPHWVTGMGVPSKAEGTGGHGLVVITYKPGLD